MRKLCRNCGPNSVPGVTVTFAWARAMRMNWCSETSSSGDRDEEVASAVCRARGDAGDFFDDCHDVVADALVLGDARGKPAFRLAEPAAEDGLVVAAAAQRHDGLELFHAVDYLSGAEGRAEAVAAEGFGLGWADYCDEVLGDFALRA